MSTVPEQPPADVSVADKSLWVTKRAAAEMLGVNFKSVPGIAAAFPIRAKVLPGLRCTRYLKVDVLKAAREGVRNRQPLSASVRGPGRKNRDGQAPEAGA